VYILNLLHVLEYTYGKLTFQKIVVPLTLCHDQDDLHRCDMSVRAEEDQDLSKHAAYVISVVENTYNASSADSINSFL
jgi:hypothetical protein